MSTPEAPEDAGEEYVEEPAPTPAERAQAAQDQMGWARMPADRDGADAYEFTTGAIDLARVVVVLANKVAKLERERALCSTCFQTAWGYDPDMGDPDTFFTPGVCVSCGTQTGVVFRFNH